MDVQGRERNTASVCRQARCRNSDSLLFLPDWPPKYHWKIPVTVVLWRVAVTKRSCDKVPDAKGHFKTYSGSGVALARASGAEVSSQLRGGKPTDSVQTRSWAPCAGRQSTAGQPHMEECWAPFQCRAEASFEAEVDKKGSSNFFFFLSVCQPASQCGWGMGSITTAATEAAWTPQWLFTGGALFCNCVVLICEFAEKRWNYKSPKKTKNKKKT